MNLLQLYNGNKQFGAKIIFDDAQFSVNENEHVGVIGPNGAGKTTLFKIIAQQLELDSGKITKAGGLRIGYLEQETEWSTSEKSEDYLREKSIRPIWELKQLGLQLGLSEIHFAKPLHELSGGYRMRMKLLEIIGGEPDLMLLDEPTNFLDLESILVLERFLQDYKGAFLLISHDREFLRRTTEHTLEVEGGEITKYPGHIDDYFEYKNEIQQIKLQQAANLDLKRKHIQSFIDRFRSKATKARQAQSRIKQLDKMESIEIKALPLKSRIHLPEPLPTGKEVCVFNFCDLGYAISETKNKVVLKKVNLIIEKGHHVGVVGFNGAGKSTLLKSIVGRIPLLAGDIKLGYRVEHSYFAQHLTDELDVNDTVLTALQKKSHSTAVQQDILAMAGSFLFSDKDIHKKVSVLSGGEKTRVALGQMLLQKRPFLILDEPTNHLDFDTVNALAESLANYSGTLLVVSHDRSFIKRVSNKILEIRDGKAELYPGTYDDYLWSLEKGSLSERKSNSESIDAKEESNSAVSEKFNFKNETKKINSEIKELQRKILKSEEIVFAKSKERTEINTLLLQASGLEAQRLAILSAEASKVIESNEDILLVHMENLDRKEKELLALKGN